MTGARERTTGAEGYEAEIKRSMWERITSFGVPRLWAGLWGALCLYLGLLMLYAFGMVMVLIPALLWMCGHGALMALTLYDPHWDDIFLAQLTRRYRAYYDAG
jgi:type IV secretory pathway TrbD component